MENYQKELAEIKKILMGNPRGMTVKEISEKIKINRNSVAKYLDVLQICGHVEKKNIGPAKIFFLSQRVPLHAMLNFSSDYILVVDKNFRIIQANDNILKLMKVKRNKIVGHKIGDSPKCIFNNSETISNIKKALLGKEVKNEISSSKNKKEMYFNIKLVPTTLEDGHSGVTIIAENVTSHKKMDERLRKSEAILRSTINASPDAITVTDLDGNITYCNQATLDLHGFSSKKELIGKNALELIAKKDHKRAAENMRKTLEKGVVRNLVYTLVTKKGKEFLGGLSASVIKDSKGKVTGFMAITKNVSKLIKRRDLNKYREKYKRK
ncbi:MAG: PAS domain S-box protein [archaeon]|nr:MAG: PAS domain S-box protein [archaeon]